VSSHEVLRKRVENILDMAVSTVSSLTESFMSGVPLGGEDAVLSKDKGMTTQDAGASDTNTVDDEDIISEDGQKSEERQDEVEEEGSELTEQSDDDGGVLEVHD